MADDPILSPEHAMLLGHPPILSSRKDTVSDARKKLRLTRLAKEYVVDFNLPKACARADLDWNQVKHAERDAYFITVVQELVQTIDPELVINRQEVLMAIKREAFNASKASDRLRALSDLARLLGMELPDPKKDQNNTAPTINLTITQPRE